MVFLRARQPGSGGEKPPGRKLHSSYVHTCSYMALYTWSQGGHDIRRADFVQFWEAPPQQRDGRNEALTCLFLHASLVVRTDGGGKGKWWREKPEEKRCASSNKW